MKSRARRLCAAVTLLLTVTAAAPAGAREEATEEDGGGLGLTVELGLHSAYVFRGLNLFRDSAQLDPNLLLAPGVSWSIFDTGLTLGWWGAFQLTGDDIDGNVDAGVGMEQDLYLLYELGLPYDLTLNAGVFAYLYPAADEKVAGATFPAYLEPQAGLTWSSVVDLSLTVTYLVGVQEVAAIRDCSYLYVSPKVAKSFELLPWVGLEAALSYGFKLFRVGNDGQDNVHDLTLTVAAPIAPWGPLTVTPTLGAAWTNLVAADLADEIVVWGGVTVAASF